MTTPSYYEINGQELMPLVQDLPFAAGNAIKYIFRASNPENQKYDDALQDLMKAHHYLHVLIERELQKREDHSTDEANSECEDDADLEDLAGIMGVIAGLARLPAEDQEN